MADARIVTVCHFTASVICAIAIPLGEIEGGGGDPGADISIAPIKAGKHSSL
jgi:hypothetical protein